MIIKTKIFFVPPPFPENPPPPPDFYIQPYMYYFSNVNV